jgi:hypothetical protein
MAFMEYPQGVKAVSSIVAPGHRWSMPDFAVISLPVVSTPVADTLKNMEATSGAISNIIRFIVRSEGGGREEKRWLKRRKQR